MSIQMTPEEKAAGMSNFERVADGLAKADGKTEPEQLSRRKFMQSLAFGGGVVIPVSAAVYFGYKSGGLGDKPVKAALIGGGDEGGVLVGEHNPKYLEFVAVCDIRPSNKKRIFDGEKDADKKP